MFLPGSFGKCLAGDESSPCETGDCEVEEWTWEELWGEISALFRSTCLVLFCPRMRSFAVLGLFSLGGGSSLVFVDCKTF